MSEALKKLGIESDGRVERTNEEMIAVLEAERDQSLAEATSEAQRHAIRIGHELMLVVHKGMDDIHSGSDSDLVVMLSIFGGALAAAATAVLGPSADPVVGKALQDMMGASNNPHIAKQAPAEIAAGILMGSFMTTLQRNLQYIKDGEATVSVVVKPNAG